MKPTNADKRRAKEKGRGRTANAPREIPLKGWRDVAFRLWKSIADDRITLIAAGAAFFLLLALFPAMTAFVSLYGFVSDPSTVADHVAFLAGFMPQGGVDLIATQLTALATARTDSLSFAFLFGLLIAIWSANSGIKSLFEGMNIAYREREKRSFIQLNLRSLAFTLGALVIGILMIVAVGVVPAVLAFLRLDGWSETIIRLSRWPLMIVVIWFGITALYRFGPSRQEAKLRWISWGAALSTLVWVTASLAFSFYLENFANYGATYGTLGAVIGFMIWTWISVTILLVGAELNAEPEHQTSVDTTTGRPKPMGERGATMADKVGVKASGD